MFKRTPNLTVRDVLCGPTCFHSDVRRLVVVGAEGRPQEGDSAALLPGSGL